MIRRRLRDVYRGYSFARELLREPVILAKAIATVRTRLTTRTSVFLDTVERAIFANPRSPYRPLFEAAGYDLVRVRALVAREGVEEALRKLCRDGVYVSIEEFKGIREARRGARTLRFSERDFNNPLLQSGLRASSSGTRGREITTTIAAANRRLCAEHLTIAFAAYDLKTPAVAVWYPAARGMSLGVVLLYAAIGNTPSRWFTQIPGRFGGVPETYSFYLGVKAATFLRGIVLPQQTCVPVGQESRMLSLIEDQAGRRGLVIDTSASQALRLALAAKQAGTNLANVTFLTSCEPLTPTKLAVIRGSGARAFSYYSFTEFGRATFGCPSPASADDAHICSDIIAIITRRRAVDCLGSEVDALLVTALRPEARRILLNVETGDYARLTRRKCGCLLEELGWVEHLEEIRSFEKLTPEGGTFLGSKLISLVEETLPDRFGGELIDYQLLEHEDPDGSTRLTVLVHPRLGEIDEIALLRCVESALGAFDGDIARVHKEAGTLRVRRVAPMVIKGAGKLMPLHRFRPEDLSSGEFGPLR